jgi:hypothetical protein
VLLRIFTRIETEIWKWVIASKYSFANNINTFINLRERFGNFVV